FLLFALGQFHTVRAMFLGSPAVVVGLLVALGLLMVVREQYGVAGVFFGLSIIKPDLVVLLIPFVLIWGVSKRQLGMVLSILVTGGLLVAGAFYFFPQWFLFNYFQFLDYFEHSFPASVNAIIWRWLPGFNPQVMVVIAVVLGLWLVLEWWRAFGKDSRHFLWTAALTLVFTNLIGVPTTLSNFVLLLIPLTLVFSIWVQRWRVTGVRITLVAMALLVGLEWGLSWLTMQAELAGQAPASMLFVFPVVTLILLYWVRYWSLNSIQLRTEHLEALRRL
ncbi:MAG: glycosyltransferase 87 family protein, partial [Anaerolineales bacterium]